MAIFKVFAIFQLITFFFITSPCHLNFRWNIILDQGLWINIGINTNYG